LDGYIRNRLPAGRLVTIAPNYASASRAQKRAQTESEKLVADFAAQRTDGTRVAVLKLLESATPTEPVSILHFAGHGQFAPEAATDSNIKLEDGALAASEIERPEVRLGRHCRTLVFFNACEVGAAGAVFGEVGGWADAFLGRQFGGFIAPLWSVDDEDAGVVACELLERIGRRHEPIGAALREIRAAHGATSPTFYSYLYYGDVTARFAAC
jgi:CHAT domain-containing protein